MKRQLNVGGGLSTVRNTVVLKGLRYDQGILIDWDSEEQSIFEYSLKKYASEVPIVRYANITQALPYMSIRDVVLRIKWMISKESDKGDDTSDARHKYLTASRSGRLIAHNARLLDQIQANILDLKVYENADLLSQARDNILEILNDVPKSFQDVMPPLQFKLNQALADFVLPRKFYTKK